MFSDYLTDLMQRYFFLGDNTVDSPFAEAGTSPHVALTSTNPQDLNDAGLLAGELSGSGYTRMPYPAAWNTTGSYVYNSSAIDFPKATGTSWVFYNVLLMDKSSGGNLMFQVPMYDAAPIAGNYVWQYTCPAGSGVRLNTPSGLVFAIRQSETIYQAMNGQYGGTTATTARKILQWIFNMNPPYPDSRTYQMALGRNPTYTASPYGHLTGWTECQGTGYQRITISSSDWYAGTSHDVLNLNEILFTDNAANNWGEISDFLLYPLNDSNTPAFWGHFSTHLNISTGQACAIGPGQIRIMFYGLAHSGY